MIWRKVKRVSSRLPTILVLAVALSGTVGAQQRIADTVHNLSVSGPGLLNSPTEDQVCVFCHAPHNTSGSRPLWNRQSSAASYSIYQSSTLDAQPGQPTGSSKLCLSCHDGTIALGEVLSRTNPIPVGGGGPLPAGHTNLGTDLSNDHPVSFVYSSSLSNADAKIRPPTALPLGFRLDQNSELQCTTCHTPHDNTFGHFLVRDPEFGALCNSCHQRPFWNTASHSTSSASVLGASGSWPYATVESNACRSCHQPHNAPGSVRLLRDSTEEGNCLNCHGGQVAAHNIQATINKPARHDPTSFSGIHDAAESNEVGAPHVECSDCHNPHAVAPPDLSSIGSTTLGGTLRGARGVTASGTPIDDVNNEFEVCFRCHGDNAVNIAGTIPRLAPSTNLRLDFNPSNESFHPVVTGLSGVSVPSLKPGIAPGTQIRCTDCHNNDQSRRFGGTGADGPHGSLFDFLLRSNYTTTSPNAESAYEYALCYQCHDRQSILHDDSFKEHSKHLDEDVACSACHDPHGVSGTTGTGSSHTHLINFDTRYVFPHPQTGELKFVDQGFRKGSCTLLCHGETHTDEDY